MSNDLSGSSKCVQKSLVMELDTRQMSRFFEILQSGFMVKAHTGCSVRTFLCGQLGISPEYVAERISTIFLDGKPLDDLDAAIIRDGSRLSLSAAMPGLVGATMRRGGFYASMRGSITYKESGSFCPDREGTVYLKLFNLVMEELGPHFLKRGIFIEPSLLLDVLSRQTSDFWADCRKVYLDGKSEEPLLLKRGHWANQCDQVYLSIIAE